ncbi:hypothetical protein CVT91_00015 [Candidatus Atribacteria bacterium HGW-Atribacteria-1]|nr:MAG: hypothetical protein CVT91_00015 [Candidatus Atribacteria bacterium HGW-Atribacteria-1]
MIIPQSTRMQKMKDFWEEGFAGWEEYVMMAVKGYAFYKGGDGQWDAADIIALNQKGRPHLSINMILPTINLITGYERQNRLDTRVYPKRGGNRIIAEILTSLTKHVEDTSNGIYERSMMFLDGIVARKGWIGMDIIYDNQDPFNGEIQVIRKNPFDITEDRNCQNYDLNKGGKYIIESYWTDKEMAVLTFPKCKKEIDKMKYDDLDSRDVYHIPGDPKNPDKFKCRMRETWWKSYEKAVYLCDRLTLERKRVAKSNIPIMQRILEIDRRQAEDEGRAERYTVREVVIPVLNCTTTMGDIELEHVVRPYGEMSLFPLMRFTPYWINGDMFGVVDNLISPQQEKNKRRSQALHLVNTSANSGFFNPEEGGADKDELEMFGSKPGVVITYKSKQPTKIEPTPLSDAHIKLEMLASNDIKEISSIGDNLRGLANKQESGVLDRQRQTQGLIGTEVIFDNYKLTHRIYAETMTELIRTGQTFSTQEVLAIAGDEKIDANIDQIMDALQSIKVGKYGCKVDKSANNPTTRQANAETLLSLAQIFPEVIPPQIIIEQSDVPKKDEILESIKAREQAQAEAQKQMIQLEVMKIQSKAKPVQKKMQLAKR